MAISRGNGSHFLPITIILIKICLNNRDLFIFLLVKTQLQNAKKFKNEYFVTNKTHKRKRFKE